MDAVENKRLIKKVTVTQELHTRVLYKVSSDLAKVHKTLTRHSRPFTMDELSNNPAMNPKIKGGIPINNREEEIAFFAIGPNETWEDRSYRLLWLQRYIISVTEWDTNKFVADMAPLVMTAQFRLKYFYPGKKRYYSNALNL